MRINGGKSCFNPGSSSSEGKTCIYRTTWKRTDVINVMKGAWSKSSIKATLAYADFPHPLDFKFL